MTIINEQEGSKQLVSILEFEKEDVSTRCTVILKPLSDTVLLPRGHGGENPTKAKRVI